MFALLVVTRAQNAPANVSLLTIQCKPDESVCYTEEIVRYDFKSGEFVSKEVILSTPNDVFRFKAFGNLIYQKRYLISGSGSIFDIQTKKLLGDGRGQLIDIVGNDVIFEENRLDRKGFFAFNLETAQYRQLPSPNVFELRGEEFPNNRGQLSPNKKIFGYWKLTGFKAKFQFTEVEKLKSVKTIKGSFYASCSMSCSGGTEAPFVWIDDESIITQRSNGDIVSININGKVRQIVKIKIDEDPDSLPTFDKDEFGNISYYCNGTTYLIDVKNKTYTKDKSILGNDFERVDGEIFWAEYFYKGKSIGRVWGSSPFTHKGFLVIDYAKEGKNLGYPDGIKIWNDIKKDWITIEVKWGVEILGWIEE